MKTSLMTVVACAAWLATGCGFGGQSLLEIGESESALCRSGLLGQAIKSTGKVPAGCTKIEGSAIGQAPLTLNVGGVTVTITQWRAKDGTSGEYVGFTFTQSGGTVSYAVKASTRTFAGTSTTWVHPDGTSGPSANGISNVTFCVNEGGTTPGEGGSTPTDGGTTPGEGGTTPGEGGTTPGEGGTTPGEGGTTPGEGGTTPGEGGTTPGEGGGPDEGGECNGGGDIDEGSTGGGTGSGDGITEGGGGSTPTLGRGLPCNSNEQCLSNVCAAGSCGPSEGGQACVAHPDCVEGYFCSAQAVCVPEIG